jgi:hypothetical protein
MCRVIICSLCGQYVYIILCPYGRYSDGVIPVPCQNSISEYGRRFIQSTTLNNFL